MNKRIPDSTYVVLVGSLYQTLLPTTVMALAFLGVSVQVVMETRDPLLSILSGAGVIAAIARLVVLVLYRGRAADEALDIATARRIEMRFAVPYLLFAVIFGAFSARAVQVATPESHMMIVGLLFGYGAGVATSVFLRPHIAVTSFVCAIAPTVLVALFMSELTYVMTGALIAVFAAGGIRSMLGLYHTASTEITSHRTFATLARADSVTGLGNRLSLREQFDTLTRRRGRAGVLAVFCLDLDKFKPVNDTYGHPVGDALLRAVSERLTRLLREGDIAARVGGDEFVIVQTSINDPDEADLLARRVARAIADPFSIEGHHILIGVSVGYAVSPVGADLEDLIGLADEALIGIKRLGGGIAPYHRPRASEARWKLSA